MTQLTDNPYSLAALWAPLRQTLEAVADGRPAELPAAQVEAFAAAYAEHIRREEDELLPMAARLVSDEALAAISRMMRDERMRAKLETAPDAEAIYGLLCNVIDRDAA